VDRVGLGWSSWAVFLCAGFRNRVWGECHRLGSFGRIREIAGVLLEKVPKMGKSARTSWQNSYSRVEPVMGIGVQMRTMSDTTIKFENQGSESSSESGPESGAGRSLLLVQIEISKPCPMDWEQMTGDEQVRYCGHCSMNVYDISAMTSEAAETLIRKHEGPNAGQLCARMYVRTDGKVVTADCVKVRFERARLMTQKMVRRVMMVTVLLLGTAGALFGAAFGIRKADQIGSNSGHSGPWMFADPAPPPPIMGKICIPTPVPVPTPVPTPAISGITPGVDADTATSDSAVLESQGASE
jgi:hypothetical protein